MSGDVHPNPGPSTFNFMHYNMNSLKAHKFSRIRLLESHINIHKLDLAAITESALDSSIDDEIIKIEGFTPKRRDLVNNATHGGVVVYLKNTLAYKQLHHLEFDPNVLVLEIYFGRKKVFFTTVYRRHSQTIEQEREFVRKHDNLCSVLKNMNPYASIFVGDFNAHNRSWWNGYRTDSIGTKLEKVFLDNNLMQLVKKLTHLGDNSSS